MSVWQGICPDWRKHVIANYKPLRGNSSTKSLQDVLGQRIGRTPYPGIFAGAIRLATSLCGAMDHKSQASESWGSETFC